MKADRQPNSAVMCQLVLLFSIIIPSTSLLLLLLLSAEAATTEVAPANHVNTSTRVNVMQTTTRLLGNNIINYREEILAAVATANGSKFPSSPIKSQQEQLPQLEQPQQQQANNNDDNISIAANLIVTETTSHTKRDDDSINLCQKINDFTVNKLDNKPKVDLTLPLERKDSYKEAKRKLTRESVTTNATKFAKNSGANSDRQVYLDHEDRNGASNNQLSSVSPTNLVLPTDQRSEMYLHALETIGAKGRQTIESPLVESLKLELVEEDREQMVVRNNSGGRQRLQVNKLPPVLSNLANRQTAKEATESKSKSEIEVEIQVASPTNRTAAGATYLQEKQPLVGALRQKRDASNSRKSSSLDYVDRLYIDTESMQLEVQAHVGSTAYLLCRLRLNYHQTPTSGFTSNNNNNNQAELQVSWVRNMQILTTGDYRYTSDERFRSSHATGSGDWILEIHNVKAEDEGQYECQVNSEPKPAIVSLSLSIITANLFIMESPQLLVDESESISLTCRVEFSSRQLQESPELLEGPAPARKKVLPPMVSKYEFSQRPKKFRNNQGAMKVKPITVTNLKQYYLYWYKDNRSLEYNNPRGNILVERHELPPSTLESSLKLGEATESDSGLYLCKLVPELQEVKPAQTRIIVGGTSAASSSASSSSSTSNFLSVAMSHHQFVLPLLHCLIIILL